MESLNTYCLNLKSSKGLKNPSPCLLSKGA